MIPTDDKFYKWIDAHIGDNVAALRLSTHSRHDIDYDAAISQIECRRKFGSKLSRTLASAPRFYFPSVLAGEQSTSDLLAAWHSSQMPEGMTAVDLTAGLGIDVFHLSERASEVAAVELDSARAEAIRHNAGLLGVDNIEVVNADCIEFIDNCISSGRRFDVAFIDPARRAADGSRVYALAECEPDVLALLPKLQRMCRLLLVKASPMLDITHTVNSLSVKPVYIAAVGTPTECKELFFLIDFESQPSEPDIEGVTLTPSGAVTFAFMRSKEDAATIPAATAPVKAGDYIYEPYPVMMKVDAFKIIADSFGLSIFHPNTKLYYSTEAVDGFPGKRYKVVEVMPYASKIIKRFRSRYPAAEVAVRNFGTGADTLRTRLGVRDAGPLRLYGLSDASDSKLLVLTQES